MHATALIDAWDRARTMPPAWRMACVLGDGAEALDVFARECQAMSLLRRFEGASMPSLCTCTQCGQAMDIDLPLDAMDGVLPTGNVVEHSGWSVTLRLPNTRDIVDALEQADSEARLFEHCTVRILRAGTDAAATELPPEVRVACDARLDELAPLANASMQLTCPHCGYVDDVPLDVCAIAFERLGHHVEDELEDVAHLCLSYAWREADVLAMSPWRRRFYLARREAP